MNNLPDLILFVDIDGVLNTKNHLRRQAKRGKQPSRFKWCPNAVAHINLLTEKIGARIVVTSTWRYEYTLEKLQKLFSDNNIDPGHVIGMTPQLIYENGSFTRGDEIRTWIEENDTQNSLHIILDDNDHGISEQFEHFIHTEEINGFADKELIKRCLMIAESAL